MAIVNCSKIKPKKRVADRGNPFGDLLVGDLLDPEQCRELELQEIRRLIYESRLNAKGCRYFLLESSTFDDLLVLLADNFDSFCRRRYGCHDMSSSELIVWFDLCYAILAARSYGDFSDPFVSICLTPDCFSLLKDYISYCHSFLDEWDNVELFSSIEDILKALED